MNERAPEDDGPRRRILVVGGGYVGFYVAMRLQKQLRPGEAKITVIDPKSYMTYQPFLPEAASGNLEPRHVIAPLRRVLNKCEVINGRIVKIDHASRLASFAPLEGPVRELAYDTLVLCPGSIVGTSASRNATSLTFAAAALPQHPMAFHDSL